MRQQNQELAHVKHEFDPIFDENSELLILGTLPSVKSRDRNFIMDIRRTVSGKSLRHFLKSLCRRESRRKRLCC